MSLSLTMAALWAIAATILALLPMRLQYVPGVTLRDFCLGARDQRPEFPR
ncbi:MAG: DUF2484 family protein [Pseudomonadota bacterium]